MPFSRIISICYAEKKFFLLIPLYPQRLNLFKFYKIYSNFTKSIPIIRKTQRFYQFVFFVGGYPTLKRKEIHGAVIISQGCPTSGSTEWRCNQMLYICFRGSFCFSYKICKNNCSNSILTT